MAEPDPEYYLPEDFLIGNIVKVYGREMFLYDCNEFTRDFYIQYMGHHQEGIKLEERESVKVQLRYPPHNGYGDEDDSLASCLRLTPRAPRRDITKLMGDVGKSLRFQAKMVHWNPENAPRRFVVFVWVADGSVGVYELKNKNSGFDEGTFAQKSRKKNPATGTWFAPGDFAIGNVVEVNSMPFDILRADEATLKYMEKHPLEFPASDILRICGMLDGLQSDLAALGSEVSIEDLQNFTQSRQIFFNKQELVTLRRACGIQNKDLREEDEIDALEDAEGPKTLRTNTLIELIENSFSHQ